ncbi:methyltransferase type 11 [Actinomadura craniellae]|uniref:Methyltransferase type 11 n=1 Tax=Actinomadura craniellae TaxID=2231787 RepID=A0A365H2I9_9ACTN|nr:methyltransferase domain-containing protein [Actinomadura craniellae]RAY13311.1 methyltransferase type 11 [Actinomadura craniellae]
MTTAHHDRVVREFTKQSSAFGDPRLNVEFTRYLARLVDFIEPELDLADVCLEVACGTGLVSRAIAPRVRHVTALDVTPAMLEQGKRESDRDAVTNLTFTRGDATELPYLDRSFTLVITRFSLHHLEDPAAAVREMVRVSRPGAGIIVADLIRPDTAADADRLERDRDPSHRNLLTADEIVELVAAAGAEVKRIDRFDVVRPVDSWLEQTGVTPDVADRIRAELRAELDGGAETGLRPVLADGEDGEPELCLTHHHAHFAAIAP